MLLFTTERPGEERDGDNDSDRKTRWFVHKLVDFCVHDRTDPEVIVHVAREDGAVIVRSLQIGRLVAGLFAKLFFEPLLVADHYLLAFGLQQADEGLDDPQSSASERNENQDLT